jgi:hypothetical protein
MGAPPHGPPRPNGRCGARIHSPERSRGRLDAPRAAPASPPYPVLNLTVRALSTRYHDEWVFRHDARQCAPSDAIVEAANGEYYIRATILIGDSQVPILSTATPATKIYVINEWMPTLEGTIYRQGSGEVVATFSGIAGGEISFLRSLLPYRTPAHCKWWGKPTYMMPLTHTVDVPGVKRDACAQLNSGHPVADFLRCSLNLYRGCLWAAERRRCY